MKKYNYKFLLRTVYGRAYPRIFGTIRQPSWIFFEILLPVLSIIAFIYVLRSFNARPEFESFAVIGGSMMAIWFNVVFGMALQLRWEKEGGNLEIYITSPTKLSWILLGMMFGGGLATSLYSISVFTISSYLFGTSFLWSNWYKAILIFISCVVSLYAVGMSLSSLFLRFGRSFEYYLELANEPIHFLSGSYYPIFSVNIIFGLFCSLIPITLGIDGLRQVLVLSEYPTFIDWRLETLIMILYAFIALRFARFTLAWMEKSAREKGTLTLKWQ